jgi:hypothetical protein
MYVTREDSKGVRWWNVIGVVAFVAFWVWQLVAPRDPTPKSPLFWVALVVGVTGVILMAPGVRVRRGSRTGRDGG